MSLTDKDWKSRKEKMIKRYRTIMHSIQHITNSLYFLNKTGTV